MQWPCNVCKVFDEWAIKIVEPYKFLYFHDVFRYWPSVNSSNFYWVHACHPLFKDYPQVIHRWHMERALLWFEVQVMFFCDTKDILHHCYMICHVSPCCDTNIVQIVVPCGLCLRMVLQ